MKLYDWIGKVEIDLAKYCICIMTALIFLAAMLRKFGHPISWAGDISTFLFAWAVFLAADAALRKDNMVRVDILVKMLPHKAQWVINCLNNIIIGLFLMAISYYGVKLSISTYYRSFSGLPWLSYTWVTIAVPLGCFLMLVTTILKTRAMLRKGWQE